MDTNYRLKFDNILEKPLKLAKIVSRKFKHKIF